MSDVRWTVHYHLPDTIDDLDLMRTGCRAYFSSEQEANAFAENHKFKKKPSYWQPYVVREKKIIITSESWRAE